MITGMERIAALMGGRLPDRVPVFCNLLDQGAEELGMTMEEYYSRGEHVAEGQLRLRRKYGYDCLWGFFYAGRAAELLGCRKILFPKIGAPNVGHMVIRTPEDIGKLQVPEDLSAHPAFREPRNCLRLLREAEGGRYPICAAVTASFTLPVLLMGMEKWMELLLTGPVELRDALLTKCSDFCVREIRALREAGADLVAYINPVSSADFLSPRQFRELALPWIERDIALAGGQGVVYFCGGGRINPVIAPVLEKTGLTVYYISPFDDIAEAKRILDGRGIVVGAINDIGLLRWSKEEIEAQVRRIMSAGAPGGGFLFGTLLMPCGIPEESLRTMLAAAYRYGRYAEAGV